MNKLIELTKDNLYKTVDGTIIKIFSITYNKMWGIHAEVRGQSILRYTEISNAYRTSHDTIENGMTIKEYYGNEETRPEYFV